MNYIRWIFAIPLAFIFSIIITLLYTFIINLMGIDTGFFSKEYLPSFINGLLFIQVGYFIVPKYKIVSTLVLFVFSLLICIFNPYGEGFLTSGNMFLLSGSLLSVIVIYLDEKKNIKNE